MSLRPEVRFVEPAKAIFDAISDAQVCAQSCFVRAVSDIDRKFGDGFAKANPALVIAFMQTAAQFFATASLRDGIGTVADALDDLFVGTSLHVR